MACARSLDLEHQFLARLCLESKTVDVSGLANGPLKDSGHLEDVHLLRIIVGLHFFHPVNIQGRHSDRSRLELMKPPASPGKGVLRSGLMVGGRYLEEIGEIPSALSKKGAEIN